MEITVKIEKRNDNLKDAGRPPDSPSPSSQSWPV